MMKASIDIGTNTALLLVAEISNGNLEVIHEEQRVPRLGEGVDGSRRLSEASTGRVIDVLKEYQEIIARDFPSVDSIKVTATSAVRDAKNRADFLEIVENKTGFKIRILSGPEEACYTFRGALGVLKNREKTTNIIIDIGGGSTEIAVGNHEIFDRYSYDMGCVRFTERYLLDNPPTTKQLVVCRKAIGRKLNEYEFNSIDNASLIGVAGTVTSLAFIDKKLSTYDGNALAGHKMSTDTISNYIRQFEQWSSEQILKNYPVVMEGRADIFLAGLLILERFMNKYNLNQLVTSTGGIRHGIILDEK